LLGLLGNHAYERAADRVGVGRLVREGDGGLQLGSILPVGLGAAQYVI
jgi:hypothetical protein